MRSLHIVTAALASLLWTPGLAAEQSTQPSERRNLLGVWDLVSAQDHRPNGDVLDLFGAKPSGTLIYTPDGRVAVQIMRDPRPTSVAGSMWSSDGRQLLPSASANEIRDAYAGYYAYSGMWEINDRAHTVTHHVRASLRSGEVGMDYVRPFEFVGEQLLLRYAMSAADGERRTRVMVWRRAERF